MKQALTPTGPDIFLDNVSFAYEKEPVLKEISLTFEPGRFYSILGPNGCGKTTLLDLLIGHMTPDKGRVFLRGKELAAWSRKKIARTIALVSQNYNINFPFTVEEVIMMGRHPWIPRFSQPDQKDMDRVKAVMARTGTDTFHDRKITALSGGERQRCVFARALCQDTPILFLDEAFSNMDISHTLRLLNLVKEEVSMQNRTVISVFHDINLASIWSDHLIFMKQGRVAACGPTDEVMNAAVIEEVFQVESHVAYNEYSRARQACFKAG
ncbi:iron complex transport system ATP-binding protein [Desulfocicer vacuolatum DSM 3385]|uniref:Iron complex transport system ATP-binding protein n=1 Tax=Desulfocicer vacuolatum DSM 3385 TaxID=1121400 RepID=A0A1W2CBB1_9BACT|nr:ABC transporter ATP-binding protein [Desulfocicer vacuolatum]SMC82449.1 iron complex transport system ATP-binding protein [Desulfocicer vacuolatum DSM 3385]